MIYGFIFERYSKGAEEFLPVPGGYVDRFNLKAVNLHKNSKGKNSIVYAIKQKVSGNGHFLLGEFPETLAGKGFNEWHGDWLLLA